MNNVEPPSKIQKKPSNSRQPSTRAAKAKASAKNETSSALSIDQDALMDAVNEDSDCLAGLTIVVTGVFNAISRDKIVELLTNHGARNTGSVSGKTDYLIAGYKLEDGREVS